MVSSFPRSACIGLAACALFGAAACGAPEIGSLERHAAGESDATIPGFGGDDDGESSHCAASAADAQGCPCSDGTAPRACVVRSGSTCTEGTQTCATTRQGELTSSAWSACKTTGESTACGTSTPTPTTPSPVGPCAPGSQTFSTPGRTTFTVPSFASLTVEVWGAGGGGSAFEQSAPPTAGGRSSFHGKLVANGGGAADAGADAPGGIATGGDTNLTGGGGSTACAAYLDTCGGPVTRVGGDAPHGGIGGKRSIKALDACTASVFGSDSGDGEDGQAPGGGGVGDWTYQLAWWQQEGWGFGGAGGAAGGYTTATFTPGQLAPGTAAVVEVGAGGAGSKGTPTAGFPGTGRNPGSYTGGNGGAGQVKISWTCP